MTNDRVIFFANGDFAIDTFETLVNNGCNIVGLVTSTNDKVRFHKKTIRQVADELSVPYYLIKGDNFDEDDFFINWLKRMDADIFCVISFKKLPKKVIRLANKCAFNVHASLLPFLRGAAPINWAIRLGYKETGLTAFVLNDKIDQGDIIANVKVKVAAGEKYTTLYKKLSDACVDFTNHVIEDVLQHKDWKDCLIAQPTWNENKEYIHKAKKINEGYFRCNWRTFKAEEFKRLVDSVDNEGCPCIIVVYNNNGESVKEFNAKIYDVDVLDNEYNQDEMLKKPSIESDGKTYINMYPFNCSNIGVVAIKKIQLANKRVMDVKDFLNGFKYFNDDYIISILEKF